jgi:thioredoxin reductase (NADPH)
MYDCVIVGAGPAGLMAATYLGRFRRQYLMIDAGQSRARRIPLARNLPGFPQGISGAAFLEEMARQAAIYGGVHQTGPVTAIRRSKGGFVVEGPEGPVDAQTVLLATGVEVVDPLIENLDEAVAAGLIRYCPICDGYETLGKSVAVLAGRPAAIGEARFLLTYAARVTYIPTHVDFRLNGRDAEQARAEGIIVQDSELRHIAAEAGKLKVNLRNGNGEAFDSAYPCLGVRPRSELLKGLQDVLADDGAVRTDAHQQTGIPGLYGAGDVLKGVDQIASACGQGAIAACAIHNRLRANPKTRTRCF